MKWNRSLEKILTLNWVFQRFGPLVLKMNDLSGVNWNDCMGDFWVDVMFERSFYQNKIQKKQIFQAKKNIRWLIYFRQEEIFRPSLAKISSNGWTWINKPHLCWGVFRHLVFLSLGQKSSFSTFDEWKDRN